MLRTQLIAVGTMALLLMIMVMMMMMIVIMVIRRMMRMILRLSVTRTRTLLRRSCCCLLLKLWLLRMAASHFPCRSERLLFVAYSPSSSSRNRYVDQYARLKKANTIGKKIREMTSMRLDLVGNLDSHDLQQFFFRGCICISHCRNLSIDMESSGCRTRGF